MAGQNDVLSAIEMQQELLELFSDLELEFEPESAHLSDDSIKALAKTVIPYAMAEANISMTPATVQFLIDYGISDDYAARLQRLREADLISTLGGQLASLFEALSYNGLVTTSMIQRAAKSNDCPRPWNGLC